MVSGLRLISASLGALLAASVFYSSASAKGGFSVSPQDGAVGSVVELSSVGWTPDVDIEVSVAWSDTVDNAQPDFHGPIALAHSDDRGAWNARIPVVSGPFLTIPSRAGFVVFSAQSAGRSALSTDVGSFIVTQDGHRPNGSGGVNLTITSRGVASGSLAFLDWEPAGSEAFFITHLGPFSLDQPFVTKIGNLTDGEWDILVIPGAGLSPSDADLITISATLCVSPCETRAPAPQALRVRRVTIRDGSIVDAGIVVDSVERAAFPPTGIGATSNQHLTRIFFGALASIAVGLTLLRLGLCRPVTR